MFHGDESSAPSQRLGQQSVVKERVEVLPLVHKICNELQDAEPGRTIKIRMGALPAAMADPSLFRQVLVNLLSNAFKFTQRVNAPIIEISGQVMLVR